MSLKLQQLCVEVILEELVSFTCPQKVCVSERFVNLHWCHFIASASNARIAVMAHSV